MNTQESVVHGSTAAPDALPALGQLLEQPSCTRLIADYGRTIVVSSARDVLTTLRKKAQAGNLCHDAIAPDLLCAAIEARITARLASPMRRVHNLTGTVLHTNLGRAILADSVLQHVMEMGGAPNNLEYDLTSGRRGDRDNIVEALLCELTGAEAATVVNNNAAAVLLTLAALAHGHEAVVSRGELVEIGGSFRMPDVMAAAGAHMVEVGTTNRTHLRDYEQAISQNTALLMKVHTSNYEVQGFTASVEEAELAKVARHHHLTLVTDLGSGALVDFSQYGLPHTPLPQEKLRAGCDVVTFSGDKLLGGPQAGLIVGTRAAIQKIRRHPLKRAMRLDRMTLAALEATLRLYLQPEKLTKTLPTLRLLTRPVTTIQAVVESLLPDVAHACKPGITVRVVTLHSQIGSGSLPGKHLPSAGLSLSFPHIRRPGRALEQLSAAWRQLPEPVIGRIANDQFLLDFRCLEDHASFKAQLPELKIYLSQEGLAFQE